MSLDGPITLAEATPLAQEVSRSIERFVKYQAESLDTSADEGCPQLDQVSEYREQRALNGDPKQFSWMDFHALTKRDPELALQRWGEVKHAAVEELRSGYRSAAANEVTLSFDAWQRAQFLAIRDELAEQWKPQNGIERSLIDMMAQAFSAQLFWQERMMCYACLDSDNHQLNKVGRTQTPRVPDAVAVDQAAQMIDRFNRIFMRSLRALRDLRRHAPTLVVRNAGQVNVGENHLNIDVG